MSAPHLRSGSRAKQSVKWNDHLLDSVDKDQEAYAPSEFGGFKDYDRRKRIKLQNQDALIRKRARDAADADADAAAAQESGGKGSNAMAKTAVKHDLFRGMVVHINGYTKPSRVELWHLIVVHGGVYKQYLEGKTDVTHILATNLTPKKQDEFRRYRVVRPEWIVDCIEAGQVLPWQEYRVVSEGPRQMILGAAGGSAAVKRNDLDSSYKRDSSGKRAHAAISQDAQAQTDGDSHHVQPEPEMERHAIIKPDRSPERAVLASKNVSFVDPPADSVALVPRPDPPDEQAAIGSTIVPPVAGDPNFTDTAQAQRDQYTHDREDRAPTKTAVDPDFIEDYYRKSRLHHLSTWKASLRTKIHNLSLAANPHGVTAKQAVVMHIDFDCFFAAVSARDRPELKDKPCAVTHGGSNSGEIASCNYAAREFGVRNGMWMKNALPMCPDIVALPYDFDAYEEASDKFYEILLGLGADIVEAVSIDEALVNLTRLLPDPADDSFTTEANAFVARLRRRVTEATGVEVSAGLGANVLQAKLATRQAKPAGQLCVSSAMVADLVRDVKLVDIPGIGDSTATKLESAYQVNTLSDILSIPTSRLQEVLGPKTGVTLAQAALGLDDHRVGNITPRKIVSIEINWGIRFVSEDQVDAYMGRLADALCKKLRDVGFATAKHVLVKVMRRAADAAIDPPKFLGHGKCDRFNNGREISESGETGVIRRHAYELLRGLAIPPNELRGIGVALTRLRPVGSSIFKQALMRQPPQKVEPVREAAHREPVTPAVEQKPRIAPGTQFVLPSQIDPSVIEHLPETVQRQITERQRLERISSSDYNPPLSQIAEEDLAALPASVRRELQQQQQQLRRQQAVQSPTRRKTDISKFVVKTPSPRKDKSQSTVNTLTQAFVRTRFTDVASSLRQASLDPIAAGVDGDGSSDAPAIDREVLAALPDDIRREVMAEERRVRAMDRRRRLRDKQRVKQELRAEDARRQRWENRRFLDLPQPSRSAQALGELAKESTDGVRDYLRDWMRSTDAPDDEDWSEFGNYIDLLVSGREYDRAASIVSYLAAISDSLDTQEGAPKWAWRHAVSELVDHISQTLRL